MNQSQSIFMPGLTARGPVYGGNSLGALTLPVVDPMVKFGIIGALLFLGMKKKIPMIAAGAGALAVWQMLPTTATAAPIAVTTNPDLTVPIDTSGAAPGMPPIAPY